MTKKINPDGRPHFKKFLLIGLLAVVPLWITWLALRFILGLITRTGQPFMHWISRVIQPIAPDLAIWLAKPYVETILTVCLLVIILYVLGWLSTKVIGQRALALMDAVLHKIPMIKTVYGGTKRLLDAFQSTNGEVRHVVLINYPSPEMKAIGLVTRTITDTHTGRQLAAVYVPTTPNPTSGFIEILPVDDLIFLEWTVNDALSFIVSGGVIGPDTMLYEKHVDSE